MPEDVKIAIVDDHPLFREGMHALLESKAHIEVVASYQEANEFLKDLNSLPVDLILMDIDMPELNGVEAAKKAFDIRPKLKIIMLSMHHNYSTVKEAMKTGVNGYLVKTANKEELLNAISLVSKGEDYYSREVSKVIFGSFRAIDDLEDIRFTEREKEVLVLVCKGLLSDEIAEQLFISPHTVESHRRSLLHKTASRNTASLVRFALENKLV